MNAMAVIKSISDNEDEILCGIIALHNGGRPFCVDTTFSEGGLYRSGHVPEPLIKFDLAPTRLDCQQANVCALPIGTASVKSVVFDPPFMFNPHGRAKDNAASVRYTMFATWADLENTYKGALLEFWRVLEAGGIVAWKCQDYTDSKTTMTHCLVYQWAVSAGFYAKDLFIRYRNHGPAWNPKLRQKHARKYHSYWFVFQKPRAAS
jgi:hypothetical protein